MFLAAPASPVGLAAAAAGAWPAWALRVLGLGLKIIAVLVGARLAILLINRFIDRLAARRLFAHPALDRRRVTTLAGVTKSVVRYFFDFFAGVTAVSLLGVDTSSLLLGAGVAGLAVGFGAQNLVRDVLSGFFLLLEDQYGVGDYVNIAGTEGIVEDIGLRTTQLRAFSGELHIIPNGSVTRVANYSRGPLRVLFEVGIPYEADTARAMQVMQEALDRAAADSDVIVDGPKVLGVSAFGPTGTAIMVWARAKSMEHWAVERALRLAVKEALDKAGIPVAHGWVCPGPEPSVPADTGAPRAEMRTRAPGNGAGQPPAPSEEG